MGACGPNCIYDVGLSSYFTETKKNERQMDHFGFGFLKRKALCRILYGEENRQNKDG